MRCWSRGGVCRGRWGTLVLLPPSQAWDRDQTQDQEPFCYDAAAGPSQFHRNSPLSMKFCMSPCCRERTISLIREFPDFFPRLSFPNLLVHEINRTGQHVLQHITLSAVVPLRA